jgi:ABC-type sulfate transport system permease component
MGLSILRESSHNHAVEVAAQIAKWLLIASSATAVGIRLLEWWRSQTKE